MSGYFYLPIASLTSLTAVPFAQLATPATTGIEIMEIMIGQEALNTAAQYSVSFSRRSTASTLPTATTPVTEGDDGQASLLTGSTTTNATGIATVTGTIIANSTLRYPFNQLGGLIYVFQAPFYKLKASSFATLQFMTAPAAATWSGHIMYRETT